MFELKLGSNSKSLPVAVMWEKVLLGERVASLKGQMHGRKCVLFKEVQGVKFWRIKHKV